jgi:hypothetical protein
MNRRLLRTALLLTVAAITPAVAQFERVITDKAPAAVIAEPGGARVHVLTAGVDMNFNGVLEIDSGDVAPQWAVIDASTHTITDSTKLDDFFNSFPIRVGLDAENRRLYMAQAGRVRAFDIDALEVVDDTVALGDYSGVSYDPLSGVLIAHMRPSFTSVGYIVGLDPSNGDTIGVYQTGVLPQMSIASLDPANRGLAFYTISEGLPGTPSALLSYSGGNPDIYSAFNTGSLGSTASDLMTYPGATSVMAVIAATGSNAVRIIDTRTHRLVRTLAVTAPTALGFDARAEGTILVGTSGGMLYRFRETDGALLDSFRLPGAIGAISVNGSIAAVAIPYTDAGMTSVDSLVVILDADQSRYVDTIAVGPHPTNIFFDPATNLHVLGANADGSTWWRMLARQTYEPAPSSTLPGVAIRGDIAYDVTSDSLFVVVRNPLTGRYIVAAQSTANPIALPRLIFDDSTMSGELTGVSARTDYLLVLERSLDPSSPEGYLHVVRRSTGERIIKARVGVDPMSADLVGPGRSGSVSVYVVNRNGGSPTLSQIAFHQDLLGPDTLGTGANHILAPELSGPVAITMNGSHTLVLVDLLRQEIVSRIPIGTSGFDGPREAVELLGSIDPEYAVTTYAGDVRLVNAGGEFRAFATDGKAEGIARVGSTLFVALPFTPTYAPDSTVVIFDLNASGIADARSIVGTLEQNAPNPATDRTRVRFSIERAAHVRLEIRSLVGELVAVPLDRAMEAGAYVVEMPVEQLAAGSYLYTLRAGDAVESRVMQVAR